MRVECPSCQKSMTILTRDKKQFIQLEENTNHAVVYCVCNHCGSAGHANIAVTLTRQQMAEETATIETQHELSL